MGIKRIIREELEGYKDSNEEDWDVFSDNTPEWTEELLIEFLEHKDIEFTHVKNKYRMKLNDGSCQDYPINTIMIASLPFTDFQKKHWATMGSNCIFNETHTILERFNGGQWIITNI